MKEKYSYIRNNPLDIFTEEISIRFRNRIEDISKKLDELRININAILILL